MNSNTILHLCQLSTLLLIDFKIPFITSKALIVLSVDNHFLSFPIFFKEVSLTLVMFRYTHCDLLVNALNIFTILFFSFDRLVGFLLNPVNPKGMPKEFVDR